MERFKRGNQFLGLLSDREFAQLQPQLEPVEYDLGKELYEVDGAMEYSYFPLNGSVSAVTVMEDGDMVEVATVGNESVMGLPTLANVAISPHRVFVQIRLRAWRTSAHTLRQVVFSSDSLRNLTGLFHAAFSFQIARSVACNGLHTVQQRCARWLLMCHDRVDSDEIVLTHEVLAIMLGVRRASVTDVLQIFQRQEILSCRRGRITVVNRPGLEQASCECYRAVRNHTAKIMPQPFSGG